MLDNKKRKPTEPKKKDYDQLVQYGLYLLGRQDYSVDALLEKFYEKAEVESDAERAIDKFIENKYVDDERMAEHQMRIRIESRHHGAFRIKTDLINKKLPAKLVQQHLDRVDEDQWSMACQKAYENKYRSNLALGSSDQKERSKRVAFLARRGFSLTQANQAINHFQHEEADLATPTFGDSQ